VTAFASRRRRAPPTRDLQPDRQLGRSSFAIDAADRRGARRPRDRREALGGEPRPSKSRATSATASTQGRKRSAIAVNDVNEFAVTTPSDSNAAANAVD
jgi:hypothetical protein